MACLQFSLDKASNRVVGIWTLLKLVKKLLWDGDNFLNDTTWESGYKGCLVHSLIPFLMTIERFWSMGFSNWSSNSVCKGGWEIVTSFPKVGSNSWTCISRGIATFFLKYTFLVIQFSGAGSMDDSSSKEGIDTRSDTFKRINTINESYRYRIRHFKRVDKVNEKRINEIGIMILVFLKRILPLKARNGKIRYTFIKSNIN